MCEVQSRNHRHYGNQKKLRKMKAKTPKPLGTRYQIHLCDLSASLNAARQVTAASNHGRLLRTKFLILFSLVICFRSCGRLSSSDRVFRIIKPFTGRPIQWLSTTPLHSAPAGCNYHFQPLHSFRGRTWASRPR